MPSVINRRNLTVSFARSITAGAPDVMEISVVPLAEPGAPPADVMVVGGPQNRTLLLANEENSTTFALVPTDHPDLTSRVLYRVGWRQRYIGVQTTHDIVMPDSDVNFADLDDLGAVLGGETYVQWTDRGVPGGVAGINSLGQVIDADGDPVLGGGGLDAANFTASAGVVKVPYQDEDGNDLYDFRLDPSSGAARKWSGLVIPASGNFGTIVHNLGTTAVVVAVYETSTRIPALVTARPNLDGDTIAVEFSAPPVSGQYTAVVIG